MENLNRKQTLKNGLVAFTLENKHTNQFFSVGTDINKGYWVYKGFIYDNTIFNIKAAKKVKVTQLNKDTVYYITTADERLRSLCNLDKE